MCCLLVLALALALHVQGKGKASSEFGEIQFGSWIEETNQEHIY